MRVVLIIAAILAASALMAFTTNFSTMPTARSSVARAVTAEAGCLISRNQWEQVKMDTPISRVPTIVGCNGETVAESRFGNIDTKMVRYETASGRSVILTFQNRRVTMKTGSVQ